MSPDPCSSCAIAREMGEPCEQRGSLDRDYVRIPQSKLGTEPNPWAGQKVHLCLKSGGMIYEGKMKTAEFQAEIIGVDRHGVFLKGGTFTTFSNINSISPVK